LSDPEIELKDSIFRFLRVEKKFINASNVFENLLENRFIRNHYKFSEMFCKERYLNRHGIRHALKSTLYALRLFDILDDQKSLKTSFEFGFYCYSGLCNFLSDQTCTVILASTFCHDVYKYFEESHNQPAALIAHEIKGDLEKVYPEKSDEFIPVIERCIWNHGGKKPATCVEEAIVILADGANCAKDRLLGNFSEEEIMQNDKKPIEYFSCQDIEKVQVLRGENIPVNVNFFINGKAAWHQISRFNERLKNSKLSNYVEIFVYFNDIPTPILRDSYMDSG